MYDQLYGFLANEEIITNQQSGFRCCTRPLLSVLKAIDSWVFDLDRGNANEVVFLDFKKAFDTVDLDVLLAKVSLYGIEESAYDWFKSYLETVSTNVSSMVRFPKSVLWAVESLRELSSRPSFILDLYQ